VKNGDHKFSDYLAGATMLPLLAVKMVRNSIERSLGATLRKVVTKKQTWRDRV
jgi:hypothetical protein